MEYSLRFGDLPIAAVLKYVRIIRRKLGHDLANNLSNEFEARKSIEVDRSYEVLLERVLYG